MVGRAISHYSVLDKLGEGGMGVVYKAEDVKLGRAVALKFLRSEGLNDAERKGRFLHEARAAAALDHPNICTVYEIDEVDGQLFMAMPFLAGRTLDQCIEEGPLPIDQAVEIALQLAHALGEAHAKGIVHRDVKPSNVMLLEREDKPVQVKLMDFGLARLLEATCLTREGVQPGTVQYMSPEQIAGEKIDHRTDIWSLGVVLYEMIVGRPPFEGAYEQALYYGIVNEAPEPLTGLRTGVPLDLERVVLKCLEKKPTERYQSVSDLAVDLRASARRSARVGQSAMTSLDLEGLPPGDRSRAERACFGRRVGPVLGVGVLLGALIAASASFFLSPAPDSAPRVAFSEQFRSDAIMINYQGSSDVAVSPDGSMFSYVLRHRTKGDELWLRRIRDRTPRLVATGALMGPFWSPDSRYLAYEDSGQVRRVDVIAGGPPVVVCEADPELGASWGKRGQILLRQSDAGLEIVSSEGGEPEILLEGPFRWPHFLPDGNHFLYLDVRDGPAVFAASVTGEPPVRLLEVASRVEYADGYLFYVRDSTLMAHAFDVDELKLGGQPIPFASDVDNIWATQSGQFSVGGSGVVAYKSGRPTYQLEWFDRSGTALGVVGLPRRVWDFALSPSGGELALVIEEEPETQRGLWIHDLSREVSKRIRISGSPRLPLWLPDGSIGLSLSQDSGESTSDLFSLVPDTGELKLLQDKAERQWLTDRSPDGTNLAYDYPNDDPGRGDWDVELFSLARSGSYKLLTSNANETGGRFSPDGRRLAYQSDESGAREVYIASIQFKSDEVVVERSWRVSTEGGSSPRWRGDGRELFFISGDDSIMAAPIAAGPGSAPGRPRELFKLRRSLHPSGRDYDVTADGQRFLIKTYDAEASNEGLHVIVNWKAGLDLSTP